jgi:hypothetical protein
MMLARRTGGEKSSIAQDDTFADSIVAELQGIHKTLWEEGKLLVALVN